MASTTCFQCTKCKSKIILLRFSTIPGYFIGVVCSVSHTSLLSSKFGIDISEYFFSPTSLLNSKSLSSYIFPLISHSYRRMCWLGRLAQGILGHLFLFLEPFIYFKNKNYWIWFSSTSFVLLTPIVIWNRNCTSKAAMFGSKRTLRERREMFTPNLFLSQVVRFPI